MSIKKILVPTDFSNAAHNALCYAIGIAEHYDAEIELVHAYTIPVISARGKLSLADTDAAEANRKLAIEQLQQAKLSVAAQSTVKIALRATYIYWPLDLAEAIHSLHGDLIVVGNTGAGGWEKYFMGSNAARIIRNAPVPVLAVPENATLGEHIRIGFAYDGEQVKTLENLAIVNSLSSKLNAHVDVFQIIDYKKTQSSNLTQVLTFLDVAQFIDVSASTVESGILDFIAVNHPQMMVMIPRKKGFFQNLISGSITTRIGYKISIPLLAIPD